MTVPAEAIDPAAVLASLGVPPAASIAPVTGGTASAIWRVSHGSRASALRVFRPGQDAVCRREVAAMEAARAGGVPVPTLHARGSWAGRPALLLEWAPGIPLAHAVRRAPWRAVPLGRAFGRTQALIHRVVPTAPFSDTTSEWIGWAGEEDRELQKALGHLAAPRPALLHLDYHPMNVLTDGAGITAVLDWANTRAGDPRADVARTYSILVVEPNTPGRQPPALSLVRRLLAWGWRRGYAEAGGSTADMAWFYAWAGAVMARDLAARAADPGSWFEQRHLAGIRAWGDRWRRRARKQAGEQ